MATSTLTLTPNIGVRDTSVTVDYATSNMDCAINNKNLHSLLPPLGHMGALISEIKKAITATKVIYGLTDSPKSHKRKKTKSKKGWFARL